MILHNKKEKVLFLPLIKPKLVWLVFGTVAYVFWLLFPGDDAIFGGLGAALGVLTGPLAPIVSSVLGIVFAFGDEVGLGWWLLASWRRWARLNWQNSPGKVVAVSVFVLTGFVGTVTLTILVLTELVSWIW